MSACAANLTRTLTPGAQSLLEQAASSAEVTAIRSALEGTPLYLVGGTVRDALLELPQADIDLTTPAVPEEIRTRLERAGIRVIPTGIRHQTVTALIHEGADPIEITTFHAPNLTPEGGVKAGKTIEEDLAHRDFTMNSMAYDLTARKLIDLFDGAGDVQARLVRAVGNPEARFREDPLRLLRAVRFAAKLGFEIEAGTWTVAAQLGELLRKTSIERIRDEFVKTLLTETPSRGLQMLEQLGFLPYVVPELAEGVNFEQNRFHYADVFRHTLDVVDRARPDLILRLAALFHDIAKPRTLSVDEDTGDRHFYLHEKVGAELTEEILTRLRFPGDTTEAVRTLVLTHMRPLEAGPGGLRRLIRDTGEQFSRWRELKEIDTLCCRVEPEEFYQRLAAFDAAIEEVRKGPPLSPLSSLAIDGNDVLALGIKAGPIVGVILRALHERVLDDPSLNEKEKLIPLAKELFEELSRGEG